MNVGDMVVYQETERSDNNVSLNSAPAIVTYVGKTQRVRDLTAYREAFPNRVYGIDDADPENLEEVEIVDLTVFYPGEVDFVEEIEPWRDEFVDYPGVGSIREAGSDAPDVQAIADARKADKAKPREHRTEPLSRSPPPQPVRRPI